MLRRDLIGPVSPSEEIRSRPELQYIVGVLHPAFSPRDEAEADESLAATSDDDPPDAYAAYGGMKQSAIGLSFSTTPSSKPMVIATYAEYEHLGASESGPGSAGSAEADESPDPEAAASADGEDPGSVAQIRVRWRRVEAAPAILQLARPEGEEPVGDRIVLRWRSRSVGGDRIWTVSLVNRRNRKNDRPIFQAGLKVSAGDGGRIVARPLAARSDPDERLAALLYRNEPEFAVGHGCAAGWEASADEVKAVWTEFLPRHEVPAVIPEERTAATLEQSRLASIDNPAKLAAALRPIVTEYEAWIAEQSRRVDSLDAPAPPCGQGEPEALRGCRGADRDGH